MTTIHVAAAQPAPVSRLLRRLGIDTQYVLLGFPLGIITVVLCMTGFWLGVGLAIIWIGLPILMAVMYLSRGFATLERTRIAPVLGHPVHHAAYKSRSDAGLLRRFLTPLTDGQSWLDLLHGMFRFIPSTIAFSLVLTWWAGAVGGLSWGLWGWLLPQDSNDQDLPELLGINGDYGTKVAFYLALGIFFAGTLYWVVRGAALMEAWFAAIARKMVVSEGAVEKHVRNIFTKLDLHQDEEQHRRVLAVLAYLQGNR